MTMEIEPTLEQEIREGQLTDAKIKEIKILIGLGKASELFGLETKSVYLILIVFVNSF